MKTGLIFGLALLGCTVDPSAVRADTITFNNLAVVGGTPRSGTTVGTSTATVFALNFSGDTDTATINSSAVNVVAIPAQVPEPGTMLLFGSGLIVLGAAARKRFAKRG